jgi:hypothetical protein
MRPSIASRRNAVEDATDHKKPDCKSEKQVCIQQKEFKMPLYTRRLLFYNISYQRLQESIDYGDAICCIQIIQINIARNLTVMSELREYRTQSRYSMYSRTCNKIWQTGECVGTSIFYSKDLMAAIIMFNRNLIVIKVSQGADSYLVREIQPKKFLRHQSILPVQRFDKGSYIQAE